jgi:hypothetical protein
MSSTKLHHDDKDLLNRWLTLRKTAIGKHELSLLTEKDGVRDKLLDELRQIATCHYAAPEMIAKWLKEHGAAETAALLEQVLPMTKRSRSGDLGEILATEIAEHHLSYQVPIRRLRWKDGRDMALRGDDMFCPNRSGTKPA